MNEGVSYVTAFFSFFFASTWILLSIFNSFSVSIDRETASDVLMKRSKHRNQLSSTQTEATTGFKQYSKPPNIQCGRYPVKTGRVKYWVTRGLMQKFQNDIPKALEYLYSEMAENRKHGQHSLESQITLEQILQTIDLEVRCGIHYLPLNSFQQQYALSWPEDERKARQLYKIREYFPEVAQFHHRLKTARPKVLEYIRQRDIFDMGAFCGDSMVVFLNYTDKIIYSYEYSPQNMAMLEQAIRDNAPPGKVKAFHKGISNERKTVKSGSQGNSGSTIIENPNGEEVELTTVDHEAEKHNMKVGLIKGDIEGYELKALQGAANVLKRDRPVVSISLYHNAEEFFQIPRMLREMDYEIEYYCNTYGNDITLFELIVFAYPKELL